MKGKKMTLGKKIKLARTERDYTQTKLAERSKSKQRSISRYELNKSIPDIKTLMKLCKALDKPIQYFLGDTIV